MYLPGSGHDSSTMQVVRNGLWSQTIDYLSAPRQGSLRATRYPFTLYECRFPTHLSLPSAMLDFDFFKLTNSHLARMLKQHTTQGFFFKREEPNQSAAPASAGSE